MVYGVVRQKNEWIVDNISTMRTFFHNTHFQHENFTLVTDSIKSNHYKKTTFL